MVLVYCLCGWGWCLDFVVGLSLWVVLGGGFGLGLVFWVFGLGFRVGVGVIWVGVFVGGRFGVV